MYKCQLTNPRGKGHPFYRNYSDRFAYIIEQVDAVSLDLPSTVFEMRELLPQLAPTVMKRKLDGPRGVYTTIGGLLSDSGIFIFRVRQLFFQILNFHFSLRYFLKNYFQSFKSTCQTSKYFRSRQLTCENVKCFPTSKKLSDFICT